MIDAGLDSRLAGGIFFSVRSANGAMRYIAQTMPVVSTESSILVSKLTSSPGLFLHSFQSPPRTDFMEHWHPVFGYLWCLKYWQVWQVKPAQLTFRSTVKIIFLSYLCIMWYLFLRCYWICCCTNCVAVAVAVVYSDAFENKRHLPFAGSDIHGKPPNDFSLLLKCVLSDMGAGECLVSCVAAALLSLTYTFCNNNVLCFKQDKTYAVNCPIFTIYLLI